MRKRIIVLVVCSLLTSLFAGQKEAEIEVRKLKLDGLVVRNTDGTLTVTATFDVRKVEIFDDVVFDFYLLLEPYEKDFGPQFFHCRTVHRYLEQKTSQISGIRLSEAALEGIRPRNSAKYAVVVTYQGAVAALENSEKDNWWEDPALGSPVENMLTRFSTVPVVRTWESDGR